MRELKFRVWFENVKRGEKKGEEIVWDTKSYYDYNPIIDNGGLLEVGGGWDIYGHSDENYVIEQYTGLKDKNGKEIYEGDIVEINGRWNAAGPAGYGENLCAVKWDEEITGFEPFNNYDCDCSVYHYAEDCEVIGNIHENHELLEEE